MEESIQENTKFLQDEGKKDRFIIKKKQLWVKFSIIFRFQMYDSYKMIQLW